MLSRYVFKKKWKRIAMAIFDAVGGFVIRILGVFAARSRGMVQRLLVVRIDSLGDGVLTLPAIRALQQRFPQAKIDFLVSRPVEDLYRLVFPKFNFVGIEETWVGPDGNGWKTVGTWFSAIRKLRAGHYDVGVDFRGDLRTILLMRSAGIQRCWGRGGTGGGFLLERQLPEAYQRHEALENLALIQEDGEPAEPEFPEVSVSAEDGRRVESWLKGLAGRKTIVMHPGAGYPSKRWPITNYAQLANRIQERNLGVPIFVSSERKQGLWEDCREAIQGDCLDLTGGTSLGELLALLKRTDLFVGNDSGPAHLAALMGCKLILVFSGTNDPQRWVPCSKKLKVIRHPVPCSPCEERVCPLERQHCLADVSVEEVLGAIEDELRN